MIKSIVVPLRRRHGCYLAGMVPTWSIAILGFMPSAGNPRSNKMSRVGFASTCFVAILLALSSQQARAQGLLEVEPQPFDGIMSPHPLGPLQKFGDLAPGSEAMSLRLQPAPPPPARQAHAAPDVRLQAQRRPNPKSAPRQTALRALARQHEWQHGLAGSGSVLSLAPRTQERVPSRPFCFPSATIHFQQGERDNCSVGAPAYRGRFEELLGE
jgi:hypothetical protein